MDLQGELKALSILCKAKCTCDKPGEPFHAAVTCHVEAVISQGRRYGHANMGYACANNQLMSLELLNGFNLAANAGESLCWGSFISPGSDQPDTRYPLAP